MRVLKLLLALPVVAFAVADVGEAGKYKGDWPSITLPWGTWKADRYNKKGSYFTFTNVRFGKAPVGDLRFNLPVYPDEIENPEEIQDSSLGAACHQTDGDRCDCPPNECPKSDMSPFIAMASGNHSEDCLFLDLYVPASVFKNPKASLPVVVWFHGGGFLFGAKDSHENGLPLYQGDGLLQAAVQNKTEVIFVAGNYRLGPFGWLAGPTVEKDGVPNVGAYDQRLVLQWVQDYIHLVGGNRSNVNAWGESAGASSIMFHLLADGGKRDPLFRKAVVLSPGFEWQWDNTTGGNMEQLFWNYTQLTGCVEGGIDCLRKAPETNLTKASQMLYDRNKCTGPYSIGPAVDGRLIRSLPAVAFAKGEYWKDMDSLIISHVADEASSFVPKYIKKEDDLERWLEAFLPRDSLAEVRQAVAVKYDQATFGNPVHRATAILRDAFFTCNTRHLYDAYNSTTPRYMMQYDFMEAFGLAFHGADLLPLFFNHQFDVKKVIQDNLPYLPSVFVDLIAEDLGSFAVQYQHYMLSHATFGDPNSAKFETTPDWNEAVANNTLHNVIETQFSLIKSYFNNATNDKLNKAETCDFWKDVALNITLLTQDEATPGLLQQSENLGLEL